jgi:hypothetical protein
MGKKVKTQLKFDIDEKKQFLLGNFNAKNRRMERGKKYAEKMIAKEHKKDVRKNNRSKNEKFREFRGKFLKVKDALENA